MTKKVYVGMSGGVDSSLTAALLKEQGYEVSGVFMKNWTRDFGSFICGWQEDYQDAKRVAVQLGIDFKVFDFENEYRQKVVDYMVREYQAGRTPNPDIMCNQEVKFKLFLETSIAEGADLIATGHYAQIKDSRLYAGIDPKKDQSYFLYRMTSSAAAKSLMPLGGMEKVKVRQMAKDRNLFTANKKDSQGICFVGKVGIKEFLSEELGQQKHGDIIDQNGDIIGEHDGAIYYTIGQRHGLNVGGGLPYYVTRKDMKNNIVYVTTNIDDDNLWKKEVNLEDLHWISHAPVPNKKYKVRLRYQAKLVNCKLQEKYLILEDQQRAISSGQSAVIYDGDEVLGGGIVV